MDSPKPTYAELMQAAQGDSLMRLAFAGVISQAAAHGQSPLIRALAQEDFQRLLDSHFPGLSFANGKPPADDDRIDELVDLLQLLLDNQAQLTPENTWLAYAMASAAMADDHLWQDMGLPNRQTLSELIARYFPPLRKGNSGDMKWKKFFYRQLCERANIPICKSPSCGVCSDFRICFGPEEDSAKPLVNVLPLRAAP